MSLEAFHFLRPWWLILLPLMWAIAIWKHKQRASQHSWEKLIDSDLLPSLRLDQEESITHVKRNTSSTTSRALALQYVSDTLSLFPLLGFVWTLCLIALAGPTWKKMPSPAFRPALDWVLVLDLSSSMNQTDVAPNRLTRARYAIQDILTAAHGARIGLVVFGEDAYTVSPLTDDTATLRALLAPLDTSILPTAGDQLAPALKQAEQLLQQASTQHGRIVVFTDGLEDPAASLKAAQELHTNAFKLDMVNVGISSSSTFTHALSPHSDTTTLLQQLATMGEGNYMELDQVSHWAEQHATRTTPLDTLLQEKSEQETTEHPQIDHWEEAGIWLLPAILALAALFYRRGWL